MIKYAQYQYPKSPHSPYQQGLKQKKGSTYLAGLVTLNYCPVFIKKGGKTNQIYDNCYETNLFKIKKIFCLTTLT